METNPLLTFEAMRQRRIVIKDAIQYEIDLMHAGIESIRAEIKVKAAEMSALEDIEVEMDMERDELIAAKDSIEKTIPAEDTTDAIQAQG